MSFHNWLHGRLSNTTTVHRDPLMRAAGTKWHAEHLLTILESGTYTLTSLLIRSLPSLVAARPFPVNSSSSKFISVIST